MAERYFGLDHGKRFIDVVEGAASTATTDVEVRVDLTVITKKYDAIRDLQILIQAIRKCKTWPPA